MKHQISKILSVILFLLLVLSVFVTQAQTVNSQETLNQYISDLQKNPNDNALREKIIKHVQTMEQKLATPEEARKYMDRGIAAIESAKTVEDFQDACAEFMKAVTAAPWLENGYRNLAIAQDKAGQYDSALKNLQLYLLTRPSSSDEAWAKTLINKVEYRKEKALKVPEKKPESAKPDVSGEWSAIDDFRGPKLNYYFHYEFEIQGTDIALINVCDRSTDIGGGRSVFGGFSSEVGNRSRQFLLHLNGNKFSGYSNLEVFFEGEILGDTIFVTGYYSDGKSTVTYKRRR